MAVCSLTVLVFPRLPADLEVSTYTSQHVESDACLAVYHFSWVRCGGVGRVGAVLIFSQERENVTP